ncbi:MAG TPA: hypothetical protein VF411_15480 [Bacteroidia bacterium]
MICLHIKVKLGSFKDEITFDAEGIPTKYSDEKKSSFFTTLG